MKRRAHERVWAVNSLLALGGTVFAVWVVIGHKPKPMEVNSRPPDWGAVVADADCSAIWEAGLCPERAPAAPVNPDPRFEVDGWVGDRIGVKADDQPLDPVRVGEHLSIQVDGSLVRVEALEKEELVLVVESVSPREIRVPLFR